MENGEFSPYRGSVNFNMSKCLFLLTDLQVKPPGCVGETKVTYER